MPSNIRRSLFLRYKSARQSLRPPPESRTVAFIVGCQRSGTTFLSQLFEKDMQSKTYGEAGKTSGGNPTSRLRLKPLDEIDREIARSSAALIVLKPLVESQNVPELLAHFDNSKAIWLYRHYRDVAASNIAKFGERNSIKDLRPFIERDATNWRWEKASEETRGIIAEHFDEDMSPADAAVLFWIARNRLFFELQLERDARVHLCKYERLTSDVDEVARGIYAFLGQSYPGDHITRGTHTQSIDRGRHLDISPAVEARAQRLLDELDAAADRTAAT